jgi:hypothetical protein
MINDQGKQACPLERKMLEHKARKKERSHPRSYRMIEFNCTHCGEHLSASPELIGVIVPCTHCGEEMTVPSYSAPEGKVPLPSLRKKRPRVDGGNQAPVSVYLVTILITFILTITRVILVSSGILPRPNLPVSWLVSIAGVSVIGAGAKGVFARRIALDKGNYITGMPARVVGVIVMILGSLIFFLNELLLVYMKRMCEVQPIFGPVCCLVY